MKDSGEPSWDPDIYELAHSIAGAYFEAVHDPKKAAEELAIAAGERETLWHALVLRIAELTVAGHTPAEVGGQVGGTIKEWESKHRLGQGPHRFIVTSPREAAVAS